MSVILIDAGTGNLRSVLKALESQGAEVDMTADPEVVRRGGRLVLPGVGAFGDFMKGLQRTGLDEAICETVRQGSPLLGICVGMQALFQSSVEMGLHPGLGLLPGKVVRFPDQSGLKLPHTGWNQLWPRRSSPLLAGLEPGAYAYFNHAFICQPDDPGCELLETDYGVNFASGLEWKNIFAVQFHPEKSQAVGLQILVNFLSLSG
jgi:imidazole glycerol-phosphate synthase subunit HisH